jgi:hypothetical protein
MAAIFIPYLLLERSCFHVTDRLAWLVREKLATLFVTGVKFNVFYDALCWYCFSVSCGPWQTRPEDISHASMLSLAYSDRLLDDLGQGCQTHSLPRCVVWPTPTFGNHIEKGELCYFCAVTAYRGNRSIGALILHLGTRGRWVANFKSQLLYPWKVPGYLFNRGLGGPQSHSGRLLEKKKFVHTGIPTPYCPTRSWLL